MTADKLTDERIIDIATKTRSADPGRDGYILPILFARAIESEVRTLLAGAAEGWQPIETAPKDGTEILACWPKRKLDEEDLPTGEIVSYAQCVTAWQGFWIEPDYLDAHGSFYMEDEAFADEPTHWKPLGPAPGAAAAESTNSFHQIAPSGEGFAASEESARPVAGSAPTEQEPPL